MGLRRDFFTPLHTSTKRDYPARMLDDKPGCMRVAKEYGQDYWDGDRRYGYGGYRYDGRWEAVARRMIEIYGLGPEASILDAGCGKAHLLYEFSRLLPGARLAGFDVSAYALSEAPQAIRPNLFEARIEAPLRFADRQFDLVLSLNVLHNLEIFDLLPALSELARVGRAGYVCVESFRNEKELCNLQCWALTCQSFYGPAAWEWLMRKAGYAGDWEFIFFE